jgi:hypothetical protein
MGQPKLVLLESEGNKRSICISCSYLCCIRSFIVWFPRKRRTDFEVDAVDSMERAATDDFAEWRSFIWDGEPRETWRDFIDPSPSPVRKRGIEKKRTSIFGASRVCFAISGFVRLLT